MKSPTRIFLLALMTGTALAQSASPLKLVLSQALVQTTTVNGKSVEKLLPEPKSVLPGAVLEQAATVTNTLSKSISNVTVNLPISRGTTYLVSASGQGDINVLFSADQGKTYAAAPLMKTITVTENGKSVQKAVEVKPDEYTNVRWIVAQLNAGESLKLGFRVKVN